MVMRTHQQLLEQKTWIKHKNIALKKQIFKQRMEASCHQQKIWTVCLIGQEHRCGCTLTDQTSGLGPPLKKNSQDWNTFNKKRAGTVWQQSTKHMTMNVEIRSSGSVFVNGGETLQHSTRVKGDIFTPLHTVSQLASVVQPRKQKNWPLIKEPVIQVIKSIVGFLNVPFVPCLSFIYCWKKRCKGKG